jgi:hypothetical protein
MTAHRLIQSLAARGVRLAAAAGRLDIDAPADVLTAEDRAILAQHKAELVAILTAPRPDPFDRLTVCRRTPWGTWCWSDPAAPQIEVFGEPLSVA